MQGWKKEHVVGVFYDGRIIVVLPTDPKLHLKKVGFLSGSLHTSVVEALHKVTCVMANF